MKLITFGKLKLEGGDLTRQKPMLLLAYLAVEGAKPRRHLAELFFSGTNDPLNSLSRTLTNLRKEAPELVEADNTKVWTLLPCDAAELVMRAGLKDYAGVKELYQGAFCADLTITLGAELEEWVYTKCELYAAQVQVLLLEQAEQRAAQGNFAAATPLAERAYTLPGATQLEPELLSRYYTLLTAGGSAYAIQVRNEAHEYGIELSTTRAATRARLNPVFIEAV